MRTELLNGWWIDTGKKDPLLECNRLLLEKIEPRIDGTVDDRRASTAASSSRSGAEIVNSTVRGPAIIGANTHRRQLHRPVHAIGAHCEIVTARSSTPS